MEQQFLYDVFLSYSSKDKEKVIALADRLKASGLKVWLDSWMIKAGDSIPAKIEDGLENSRVLVLCLSANVHESDWAIMESGTFRFRDPLNKERRFIPLKLDDAKVKGSLAQFSYISWENETNEEYNKLLEVCVTFPTIKADSKTKNAKNTIKLNNKSQIFDFAFSKDKKRCLTVDEKGYLCLYDIERQERIMELKVNEGWVNTLQWDEKEDLVYVAGISHHIKVWDLNSRKCITEFKGHDSTIDFLILGKNSDLYSSSRDKTIRIWDTNTGKCIKVLHGHNNDIPGIYLSDKYIVSCDDDGDIKLWNLKTGELLRAFVGHASEVYKLIITKDNKYIYSGSWDKTIRLWDLETGQCLQVLEGHEDSIWSIALSPNEQFLLSGDSGGELKLWEPKTGRCIQTFTGYPYHVEYLEWRQEGAMIVSGDTDGNIMEWDVSEYIKQDESNISLSQVDQVQYTNAKILVVGESGAGKTGLTERLCLDTFTPSYSTAGTWSTQWKIEGIPEEKGLQREVWLWDFGGQADQRLIHQLYMDNTAMILLVFNADQETVVPPLRNWQQALVRHVPKNTPTYLVAGRTDAGFRFNREKVTTFATECNYKYFETSANNGKGCTELRNSILQDIPWRQLEKRTSPALWKLLKDEILRMRDAEKQVLYTYKELRETLRQNIPLGTTFNDRDLETVISLLDGPGVVKELGFGSYILLRPEWINIYAQAVIRTLRADVNNIGLLPVSNIADASLIFQTEKDGEIIKEKRLESFAEEQIVLQAMEQMLLERQLSIRQDGTLIFPSYYGLEMPIGPIPPVYYISYRFSGYADDIYATLVVRLLYCRAFLLGELWKDAANFKTLNGQNIMGIKLQRNEDGTSTLLVHYEKTVTMEQKVIFANYIHSHLEERAVNVQRQRHFVCNVCGRPVRDLEFAMEQLEEDGKNAKIMCLKCEQKFNLWDELEDLFASEHIRTKVAEMQQLEHIELDTRRKGKLLALEVMARITSADQKCFEIPGVEDEGIDVELEFTEDNGRGSGKRYYLQLKSGNSYLQKRADGTEVFVIKKQQWVEYWLKQPFPIILVIGTFPEGKTENRKERFEDVRWMDISEVLKRESNNGKKPVKQIIFEGKTLDTMTVRRWRDKALGKK